MEKSEGAYNIAVAERVTLEEFVRYFCDAGAIKYLNVSKGEGHPNTFYPSVDLGPISIRRAVKELNFKPTSLDEVMKRTLSFFDNVLRGQYISEKIEVIDELPRRLKYFYCYQITKGIDLMSLEGLQSEKDGKRLLKKYKKYQKG